MIYLDNSATSRFKPYELNNLMKDLAYNSANAGRSGHSDTILLGQRVYAARQNIKRLCSVDDEYETIYTSNCSEALNLAILGYVNNLDGRIHVITTMNEHNSVLRPLRQLELQNKITTTYLAPNKDGVITASMVDAAMLLSTKLVIINHTSNVTGATSDVYEIGKVCKARNVTFMVDGAQSLGHVALNAKECNIAMLAGAGHKGLHGLQGIGFLLLRRDISLKPLKFGGTGTSSESVDQPTIIPESLECGTLNSFGALTLDCGINWTMANFESLHHTYRMLSSELLYGMRHIGKLSIYSQYPSSVISFNVKDYSSAEVSDYLNEHGIAVRSGLHCAPFIHKHLGTLERGAVRASLGYNNTPKDIKLFLLTLEQLIRI